MKKKYKKGEGNGLMIADIPHLLEEFSSRNPLPANETPAKTGKKLWWLCTCCEHEWQARGRDRMRGNGCVACSGWAVTEWNNLARLRPDIARDYSGKNLIPADQITAKTAKVVWWKCHICGYEWPKSVRKRTVCGYGCPACGGKVVTEKNNLAVTHPELAREYRYDPERVGQKGWNKLPPNKIYAGSHKKVWWECTCGCVWRTSPSKRRGCKNTSGTGCPWAAGKKI